MFVTVFAGLLIGICIPNVTSFAPAAVGFIVSLTVLCVLRQFAFLAGILVGAGLANVSLDRVVEDRIAPRYAGDSIVADCTVLDFPRERAGIVRFEAHCRGTVELPRRVVLTWRQPPVTVRAGDRWQLELRLKRPDGLRNPAGFDHEKAYTIAGIGARGYIVESPRNRLRAGERDRLTSLRLGLADKISSALPRRESAAVVTALAIGARHAMNDSQWQRYARSGTTHLVAISGLHVGLVAGFAALGGRLLLAVLRCPGNHRRASLLIAALAALAYVALSGFGIPALRALAMLLIALLAWSTRRESAGFHLLAIAGVLLAIADPLSVWTPGFLMSFAAVACLLWHHRGRREAAPGNTLSRFVAAFRLLSAVQLALFMGLIGLSAALFGRISLSAPLINLIAIPLFGLVTVPATLVSLLPGPHGDVGFEAAAVSIEWLDAFIGRLGDAQYRYPATSTGAVRAAAALALTWCLLPAGWPGRWAAFAVLPLLFWPPVKTPPAGCVDATFLDVGQGTSVFVRTARHRLLYDTGPAYRSGSAARSVVLPYLKSRGEQSLDRLVISHADLDHAGGIGYIESAMRVGDILVGEALPGVDWRYCDDRTAWHWDGVHFAMLHPAPGRHGDGNDSSCVLLISAGDKRLLLAGDIEKPSERRLLRHGVPKVDVLLVPHHGSATSSTVAFVAATSPELALMTAGHNNRWGLPKQAVVERWAGEGAIVLNTATEGAVEIRVCDSVRVLSRHRRDELERWHRRPGPDPMRHSGKF